MKRRRVTYASARPIDKRLVWCSHTLTTGGDSTAVVSSSGIPCTAVGFRWSIAVRSSLATAGHSGMWAMVVVPDGESVNSVSTTDGNDLYTPEQNVLAFGVFTFNDVDANTGGNEVQRYDGSTKTQRKLRAGDSIYLISQSTAASSGTLVGIVQMFCRT